MPSCKKCSTSFPNRLLIDGKQRNLSGRKFCLSCSPFNRHNTKDITQGNFVKEGYECECERCGRHYIYIHSKGSTTKLCNSCQTNRGQLSKQIKALEYLGNQCKICNYAKCRRALHFHHLNPEQKQFGICGNYNRKWDSLKNELDKCVILCANCHAEVHDGIINLGT